MLSLTEMAAELQEYTAWQETPELLSEEQYIDMVIRGLKRLFIDTGRAFQYTDSRIIRTDDVYFDGDLMIDEEYYVMLCARIEFFKKVQSDVNNIISYTTNALSVANADKPYANLKNTVDDLENERRIVYYKMARFTLGE